MSSTITSIIVSGATGRAGSRVCALALRDESFALAGALTHAGSARLGAPVPDAADARKPLCFQAETSAPADVVIDFSTDEGARRALRLALDRGAALLVATTALSDATVAEMREAAKKRISVIVAPNTSLGVAAAVDAAARLAGALGPTFAASIVEAHHSRKKDAPSGTALRLARAVRGSGGSLRDDQILAIRAGDIVGEHTLRFVGEGESIELVHRAASRDVFARGALRAAKWLHGRSAGWWTMEDVLGFARAGG